MPSSPPTKAASPRAIGVLGGAFNPIHMGHIKICETILAKFLIEKCVLMPNYQSPTKWSATSVTPDQRLKMIQLSIEEFKDLGLDYSTWEMDQKSVSYTVFTLQHLNDAGYAPLFILGADAFTDIAGWKDYRKLFSLADFAVVSRPSHTTLPSEQLLPLTLVGAFQKTASPENAPEVSSFRHTSGKCIHFVPMAPFPVSSTELRARLREGKDCLDLIPTSALNFIYQHRLYTQPITPDEEMNSSHAR